MSENRFKELRRNTIIIAIATIGSKAISFILSPMYSYYIGVDEYGIMDIVLTTVSLLIPVVTLDIFQATFRFSCDDQYSKYEVLGSSLVVSACSIIIPIVTVIISAILNIEKIYIPVGASIYVSISAFVIVLEQYNRGINKMRVYAYGGLVNSLVLLISNLILMVVFRYGLFGWVISFLAGKTCELLFVLVNTKLQFIKKCKFNKELFKQMLHYCIPLLPTQVMWWIMNASDRYVLTIFSGIGVVGLYSTGSKIPHLLSMFENIFYQSWQTSAIASKDSNERDVFYSNIFNNYFYVLSLGVLILLTICKPVIELLWAESYGIAWLCVAPLILSVLVHALGGNLGSFYAVFKSTNGAFVTSLVGAITNLVLNFIFIPRFGFVAAACTTLVGYIASLIVRWYDVKKFVHIQLNVRKTVLYITLIVASFVLYYFNSFPSYCIRILFMLIVAYMERKTIQSILKVKK